MYEMRGKQDIKQCEMSLRESAISLTKAMWLTRPCYSNSTSININPASISYSKPTQQGKRHQTPNWYLDDYKKATELPYIHYTQCPSINSDKPIVTVQSKPDLAAMPPTPLIHAPLDRHNITRLDRVFAVRVVRCISRIVNNEKATNGEEPN